MQHSRFVWFTRALVVMIVAAGLSAAGLVGAQDFPPAEIVNDEGGTVIVSGDMLVTNANVLAVVAQPLVILEDQAGFVARDRGFLFPKESQVLGQFLEELEVDVPTPYTISLPIEPQGTQVDVDNDGVDDVGVQVFTPAYWNNAFGDPFLEQRDQAGGGWSSAYAGTFVDDNPDNFLEVIGGSYIIYAPDDQQGFPAGFGADGLLFTEDDPIVSVPAGYTHVILDTEPFTFDRSRVAEIPLLEPESVPFDDFSDLSYTAAFDALVDKAITDYAFTEFYGIDWEALRAEFRPRFEAADASGSVDDFILALNDFALAIPDGHVAVIPSTPIISQQLGQTIGGGIGLALVELDDGRIIANFVTPGGSADGAGIMVGAEITGLNGMTMDEALKNTPPIQSQSTDFLRRLDQLQFVTRGPVGSSMEIRYINPGGSEQTTTLQVVPERDSLFVNSQFADFDRNAAPVEFEIRDDGYGYVKINNFTSNEILMIQTLEFFLNRVNEQSLPGVIIDMRTNPGGFPFLADQLSAYFFNEEVETGNRGSYNEDIDAFFFDPDTEVTLYPPPQEELRYLGPVAVLIGPGCASACERFAYNMTLRDNTEIVGHYPTAGLGGGVEEIAMPDGNFFNMTVTRSVNSDLEIHIEGQGIEPTIEVPITEAAVLTDDDVILDAAIDWLNQVNGF